LNTPIAQLRACIANEQDVSPQQDRSIRAALCECFPADVSVFGVTRAWHGSAPSFSCWLELDQACIAHVGVVDRVIRVGESSNIHVAGIQNVFVVPAYRGRRLIDLLMYSAMAVAHQRSFDQGLLFCVPELESLYQRQGWRKISDRLVTRRDSSANNTVVPLPPYNIAMSLPLHQPDFPDGNIDLQGDDW
jgi:GNAT superfamily N-acetyltransferase